MANDNLEFGLRLGIDMDALKKEWEDKEKDIQKMIDDSAFKIRLDGVEGLDKIRDQLKEIQKLQKDFSKPLTGAQALREQLKHEERARLANAKAIEFEAGSADRLRRQKAQAELTELRLARAKEKSVKVTNAQTQSYRTQTGVLNGLKQFMNSYISLLGGYRLMSNIKQITSEFELQRVSLRAITQDAQFADALFAKIKATATESPFATKELVTYTKQLAAYRIENEQLYGTMNMLADVSAGLGVSMDRLILAYGQVKAASVLRGTELRQFTEAGIPLVDELAKKFSQLRGEVVSTGEVFDLISTRQVPFEMVADIFKEMTAEGGRFYEMQKKQAESLAGVFANLKDNIQQSFDEIGQAQRGLLMGIGKLATIGAKNLDVLFSAITPLIVGMGAYRVATVLATKGTLGLSISSGLLAKAEANLNRNRTIGNAQLRLQQQLMIRASAANNRYAIAIIKAATATNVFTRSWYALKAAIIANPIGAILTVLSAGYAALSSWTNKLGDTDAAYERASKTAKSFKESVETEFKLGNYQELESSLKKQEMLLKSAKGTYSDFKKIFPELAKEYETEEEWKNALNKADTERQSILSKIKAEYGDYFQSLTIENGKISGLSEGYANLAKEMGNVRIERLKSRADELEAEMRPLEKKLESGWTKFWYGSWDEDSGPRFLGIDAPFFAELKGKRAELQGIQNEIKAIEKAIDDAAEAQLLWRQEYNKFMKDGSLDDAGMAALKFSDTIKETRSAWKDATAKVKEYEDAIKAAASQAQTGDLQKNVEWYNRQLSIQKDIIKNAENYAKFAGFSLDDTKGKGKSNVTDALKSELSLVEKIYKRYGDLKKMMSDTAAQRQIERIYGSLTDIDFLEPQGLKKRLQALYQKARSLGDNKLAMEIALKIQDVDLNEAKTKLQAALDKISQEVKQQRDASEFFSEMLGLTGDAEISTRLTLGITGIDLKTEGVGSLLSKQLADILALSPVAAAVPTDFVIDGEWNSESIQKAIQDGELTVAKIQEIIANLTAQGRDDLASTLQESLSSFVDYNKQMVKEVYSTLAEYGDFADKIELVKAQTDAAAKIRPPGIDDAAWDAYIAALQRKQDEAVAAINFDKFKKEFALQLSNMDIVSNAMLQKMRDELTNWLGSQAGLNASEADRKAVLELIEKIDNIKLERNPFEEWVKALDNFKKAKKGGNTDEIEAAWYNLQKASKVSSKSIAAMSNAISGVIDGALDLADTLGIAFSDDTQEMIEAFRKGLKLVAPIMTLVGASMIFAADAAMALQAAILPLLAITVALSAAFAAINWLSNKKVRAANKEIERQERLLKNLERAYDRLEETQEQLVGTDWVRNQQQQIANLQRQISAFEAQRAAEQSKGKKRDEDAIEDYTDKILDAQKQIRELQRGVTEEMLGTGLPDAAKDFAQSWLDAYLSFDDTMGALKASFKDMMKTMVQNSMMAKLVQKRLEPVFAAIDRAYEDAELTPAEWQSIMDMGNRAIEYIDDDLTHLAEMLGLRNQLGEQDTSNLTGIAKGVAQASEETVLTLAGYANSILYYQVWIKDDVAAIRAIMEGKAAAVTPAGNDGGFNVGQLVTLQQQSLNQLQAINANTGNTVSQLQELNNKIDSVISAQGTSSRKVLNTRLSN